MTNNDVKKNYFEFISGFMLPIIAIIASLLSCSGMGTRPSEEDTNAIVVRAYLYAGKPVSDVRLLSLAETVHDTMIRMTRWDSFYSRSDSIDTVITWVTPNTIDNAVVTISSGGVSYGLTFRESGWYEEQSGGLVISEGRTYRIDVIAGNRHAWAETTVPSRVGGLRVSRNIIYKDSVQEKDTSPDTCGKYGCPKGSSHGLGKAGSNYSLPTLPDSLTHLVTKWNNPDRAYLYYRYIMDTIADYRPTGEGYIAVDSLRISSLIFKMADGSGSTSMPGETGLTMWYPGRFELYIYSTTPDYQAMLNDVAAEKYDSTHQNQERWTKSPTNVHGGLGYFTSFSIDSTSFTVGRKDGGS